MEKCEYCGAPTDGYGLYQQPSSNHLHAIVPARMPEQSHAEPTGGDSSVPGDSRREVEELLVEATNCVKNRYDWPQTAIVNLIQALRILNLK